PINRRWFLAASLGLLAGILAWLGDVLPLSEEIVYYLRVNPYSTQALQTLALLLAVAWTVQVVPWSYLLARRMAARGRPAALALAPLILSGAPLVAIGVAAGFLGGPINGQQSADPALATWREDVFPTLDLVLQAATASAMLAGITAAVLSVEALRPDTGTTADVFT
ncbi:MAG: hypothetical protein AAF666_14880, partial [Pseudomonadota bacterium]